MYGAIRVGRLPFCSCEYVSEHLPVFEREALHNAGTPGHFQEPKFTPEIFPPYLGQPAAFFTHGHASSLHPTVREELT